MPINIGSLFGANLLAASSARDIGSGFQTVADAFTDTGVRKTRNTTRDIASEILALDNPDTFDSDLSKIIGNRTGRSYDVDKINESALSAQNRLVAGDAAAWQRGIRQDLFDDQGELHDSNILLNKDSMSTNAVNRRRSGLEISSLEREAADRKKLRETLPQILADSIDPKTGKLVSSKLDLAIAKSGMNPGMVQEELGNFQTVKDYRTAINASAEKSLRDETAARKLVDSQTLGASASLEQVDASFNSLLNTLEASTFSTSSDGEVQQRLRTQYEAYKTQMPAYLALQTILNELDGSRVPQEFTDRVFGGVDTIDNALNKTLKNYQQGDTSSQDRRFIRSVPTP